MKNNDAVFLDDKAVELTRGVVGGGSNVIKVEGHQTLILYTNKLLRKLIALGVDVDAELPSSEYTGVSLGVSLTEDTYLNNAATSVYLYVVNYGDGDIWRLQVAYNCIEEGSLDGATPTIKNTLTAMGTRYIEHPNASAYTIYPQLAVKTGSQASTVYYELSQSDWNEIFTVVNSGEVE